MPATKRGISTVLTQADPTLAFAGVGSFFNRFLSAYTRGVKDIGLTSPA